MFLQTFEKIGKYEILYSNLNWQELDRENGLSSKDNLNSSYKIYSSTRITPTKHIRPKLKQATDKN